MYQPIKRGKNRVAEWPSGAKLKTAFHWLRV